MSSKIAPTAAHVINPDWIKFYKIFFSILFFKTIPLNCERKYLLKLISFIAFLELDTNSFVFAFDGNKRNYYSVLPMKCQKNSCFYWSTCRLPPIRPWIKVTIECVKIKKNHFLIHIKSNRNDDFQWKMEPSLLWKKLSIDVKMYDTNTFIFEFDKKLNWLKITTQ